MNDDIDKCIPDGSWKDFVDFLWFEARLIFWSMSFYVFVQFVYSFTGKLIK